MRHLVRGTALPPNPTRRRQAFKIGTARLVIEIETSERHIFAASRFEPSIPHILGTARQARPTA